MASVGGFFSALGKGARAVGRGAMKGVLGFDDRDVRNRFGKKKEPHEEPDGDEMNENYSGFSRGVADLEKPAVESDGMLEEFEMETPVDIGVGYEEPLIGLEMPSLPGFKGKGGAKGGKPASGMSLRIEPPKVTPTAYETVSGGAAPIGMAAPGAGAILDSEDSTMGRVARSAMGDPDAVVRQEYEKNNPGGVNEMRMPWYMGLLTGTKGASPSASSGVPGLTRSSNTPSVAMRGKGGVPAKSEVIEVNAMRSGQPSGHKAIPGMRSRSLETSGTPEFEMMGGSGPTPYGRPMSEMRAPRQLTGRPARPMPGPGGAQGPMEPLPPGIKNRFGKWVEYAN
jgi:hypothetical protein